MSKEKLGEVIIESQEKLYHIAKSMLFSDDDCEESSVIRGLYDEGQKDGTERVHGFI